MKKKKTEKKVAPKRAANEVTEVSTGLTGTFVQKGNRYIVKVGKVKHVVNEEGFKKYFD